MTVDMLAIILLFDLLEFPFWYLYNFALFAVCWLYVVLCANIQKSYHINSPFSSNRWMICINLYALLDRSLWSYKYTGVAIGSIFRASISLFWPNGLPRFPNAKESLVFRCPRRSSIYRVGLARLKDIWKRVSSMSFTAYHIYKLNPELTLALTLQLLYSNFITLYLLLWGRPWPSQLVRKQFFS